MQMNEILSREIWGNTVLSYLIAAGSMILVWAVIRIFRGRIINMLLKFSSKTSGIFDDLLINAFKKLLLPYIYLIANIFIIRQLNLPEKVLNILSVTMVVITTYYMVRIVNYIIQGAVELYMHRKNEPAERIKQLRGMLLVIFASIWIIGIIMMIDNLGFDITTIIAGLGVGGIAIALAAQNILGDLFSYMVIFFDKPFEIGDFINANGHSGVVEKIGIKTSHIRSLDGQQLVMPNAELVKSVIQNFKRLQRRRVVFMIGVVYQTPADQLRRIPDMIQKIISPHEHTTFDRAHFKSFGDFSLNFEIVYYIDSTDFKVYVDTHQSVCFKLIERFEQEGIGFAYPTQTIFVEKDGSEQRVEEMANGRG